MDTNDVSTAAAPSSATTEQVNPYASGKLTKEISAAWTKGEEIKPKTEDPASSETSKETTSEAKAESAPVTEPGKDKQENGSGKRKLTADERILQLEATIEKIKQSKQAAPAAKETESAPVKPVQSQPVDQLKALVEPKEPQMEDFEKYEGAEGYAAAHSKWVRDLAEFSGQKAVQDERQRQTAAADQVKMNAELEQGRKTYKDFDQVVTPVITAFNEAKFHPAVQAILNSSPAFVDVVYAIGSSPENIKDFVHKAQNDPAAAIRLAIIAEHLILQERNKAKSDDSQKKESTSAKTETTEPPKATREVGNRGTGPDDPAADAVRRSNGKLTKEIQDAWMRKSAKRLQN